MESELLKEPWTFPRTKADPAKTDTAALSVWEEDFQDLSDWCRDTFQGQCDFHIGESTRFKLSGTKYEGNGVSTVEKERLKNLRSTTDDEKWDLKMNTVKTTDEPSDNRHLLLSPPEMVTEYTIGYTNNEENNISSSWLMSPESTASTSTSSSKQHSADVVALLQSECRAGGDPDYTSPTSFDVIASQREMWDELRTIETTGSNTFDLLSYLWEDEVRSQEVGVSSESTAMSKLRPLVTASPVFSLASGKVKTEEEISEPTPPTRRRMETRATSTVTSSSAEAPVTASRRSERTKAVNSREKERVERVESPVERARTREKDSRKRYYESDSEDDLSLSQYRECREKNNEASRRSRMNKKAKESEMSTRAIDLERDNKVLKMKVEELEKLVTSMRTALLRCALKKEF